jgi:hypothetical protein
MSSPQVELHGRNQAVARVVELLAAGEYARIAELAPSSRVTPHQLEEAVVAYGRQLMPLPAHAYELIDYVAVAGSEPAAWSVVIPLFTLEEGRSDLSLELELVSQGIGRYEVSVDNVHVL